MRLAIVTNIPAPYRVPVYNLVAATPGVELHVYYARAREPDRNWDLPELRYEHTILDGRMYTLFGRYIHINPDVYGKLGAFNPDVLVTTGFNPTHLQAFWWAWRHRRRHVPMTDGTDISEANLSALHRMVRRFVYARSQAFVASSDGGRRLYRQYGIADDRIHISPLCANTTVDWNRGPPTDPALDLLFSGHLRDSKNPSFFLKVACSAAALLGRRISVGILGAGPLEKGLRAQAAAMADRVDVYFAGHVSQAELPSWFWRARLFLFPSSGDVWGVVANEACHAGLPVIVSPHAGVAGELIRDGVNGYVLPLDVRAWAEVVVRILSSDELREHMSAQARRAVALYNFERAAQGILDASRQAVALKVSCHP